MFYQKFAHIKIIFCPSNGHEKPEKYRPVLCSFPLSWDFNFHLLWERNKQLASCSITSSQPVFYTSQNTPASSTSLKCLLS
jgi:hypothetical protein